jgi:dTDP-4-dehydrorhamnose 3,5-epimerase
MQFNQLNLQGAMLIQLEKLEDERGFFARSFCQNEFKEHHLRMQIAQSNVSCNKKRGTIRGMHYQISPYEEAKLVSCIRGAIYDVIIDLRPDSPTFKQWLGTELRAQYSEMLYVPEGFAHGFQTLTNNAVVFYQMFEFYHPESSQGVRFDDEAFDITWPLECAVISKKDLSYREFAQ